MWDTRPKYPRLPPVERERGEREKKSAISFPTDRGDFRHQPPLTTPACPHKRNLGWYLGGKKVYAQGICCPFKWSHSDVFFNCRFPRSLSLSLCFFSFFFNVLPEQRFPLAPFWNSGSWKSVDGNVFTIRSCDIQQHLSRTKILQSWLKFLNFEPWSLLIHIPGLLSSIRINILNDPIIPDHKANIIYKIPIFLWFVDINHLLI